MKISVIGLGYIGLPTACLFVNAGHEVSGVDIDKRKITAIQKGLVPFEENDLQKLLATAIQTKRFNVGTNVSSSDVYIIAVPTPEENHKADLRYVFAALKSVIDVMRGGELIVIESTVYPGACRDEITPFLVNTGKQFLLAHCPERAIPGSTLYEMVHNDRIIGADTKEAQDKTKELYGSFVRGNLFLTDTTTAETCKVMENTYRDVNIALANEYAKIAQELKINIWEAIKLANKHPRVHIHSPGPGVGGHCIPVDPWFFVGISKQAKLIRTARDINDGMPLYVFNRLKKLIRKHSIKKPIVGILGLSYKKNVGDIRESPTISMIKLMKKNHMQFFVHDVYVTDDFEGKKDIDDVLSLSNIILIMTDHDIYNSIDFGKFKNILFIYDTRQCIKKKIKHIPLYALGDNSSYENSTCH